MDKFYFPMETMRITQSPYGTKSHLPHNSGTPKDFPIDSAGEDGRQSACFAPTNMKITAIRTGKNVSNTVWLVSTDIVKTPTFEDKVFMTITHWNDGDGAMKKHHNVGDIVKKGEIICYEGTDMAEANHLHICCGRGYSDNWVENSNKKWVMTGDNLPPEQVMYVYTGFTTKVMEKGGLNWEMTDTDKYEIKYVGNPVPRNPKLTQLNIIADKLRARREPSLNGEILGYMNKGYYDLQDEREADGYIWYMIQDMWVAYNPDWEELLPHEETKEQIQRDYMNRILENIPSFLENLIEK